MWAGAGTSINAELLSRGKPRAKRGDGVGSTSPACPHPGCAGASRYMAAGTRGRVCWTTLLNRTLYRVLLSWFVRCPPTLLVLPLQMGGCSCFAQGLVGVLRSHAGSGFHTPLPTSWNKRAKVQTQWRFLLAVYCWRIFHLIILNNWGDFFGEGVTEVCFIAINPHGQN